MDGASPVWPLTVHLNQFGSVLSSTVRRSLALKVSSSGRVALYSCDHQHDAAEARGGPRHEGRAPQRRLRRALQSRPLLPCTSNEPNPISVREHTIALCRVIHDSLAKLRVVLVPVHRLDDAHEHSGCHERHLAGVVAREVLERAAGNCLHFCVVLVPASRCFAVAAPWPRRGRAAPRRPRPSVEARHLARL